MEAGKFLWCYLQNKTLLHSETTERVIHLTRSTYYYLRRIGVRVHIENLQK